MIIRIEIETRRNGTTLWLKSFCSTFSHSKCSLSNALKNRTNESFKSMEVTSKVYFYTTTCASEYIKDLEYAPTTQSLYLEFVSSFNATFKVYFTY